MTLRAEINPGKIIMSEKRNGTALVYRCRELVNVIWVKLSQYGTYIWDAVKYINQIQSNFSEQWMVSNYFLFVYWKRSIGGKSKRICVAWIQFSLISKLIYDPVDTGLRWRKNATWDFLWEKVPEGIWKIYGSSFS